MTLLALYWSIMIACYLIAGKLRRHKDRFHFLDKLTSFFIYLLIFLMGLRMGAEDYIVKPFEIVTLLVRIERVLARTGRLNQVYRFRDLTLDAENRTLTYAGEPIDLPPLEFDVLAVLMKNKNRTVSRERILNEIWGEDYFGDIRTVDVRVANLRKKLGLEERIRTVFRVGYRLEV